MTDTNESVSGGVLEKSGSIFDVHWNETSETKNAASYRSVSILAILALIFGVLSFTMFLSWGWFFVPVTAVVLSFLALHAIKKSEGSLFGGSLAHLGLFLAVFSVFAYVTVWKSYEYYIVRESIPYAKSYVEFITKEYDLIAINQYGRPYWARSNPPYTALWEKTVANEMGQESMTMESRDPCRRTLMALKDKASVSFHKVKYYARDKDNNDVVCLQLAVTYPANKGDNGNENNGDESKETFFVDLTLQRVVREEENTAEKTRKKYAGWEVKSLKGPVLPVEFGGKEET
ncbi:MAG: hypothetical protein FWC50_03665 [Planctomycetaceae bacterium]|nr:hypothetical protein [Planctomycetaceae bacterium]